MQSFLKDKIHISLAAFFSVTFFEVPPAAKPMSTWFGFFWFFLSAGSSVDNFLNVPDFSETSYFRKRPITANKGVVGASV